MQELKQDIAGFQNPEDIDDDPLTAPSKRISRIFKAHHIYYDKVAGGALALLESGLGVIRRRCSKFDQWLKMLESPP